MRIKMLSVLLMLIIGCGAGTNGNLEVIEVQPLTASDEGVIAIQEVQQCLVTSEDFRFVDLIIVADEAIESCGIWVTLCASDTAIYVTQKHYEDVQKFLHIWVLQLKHELGHIYHNILYGNLDSQHDSSWFEGRQSVFICNKEGLI